MCNLPIRGEVEDIIGNSLDKNIKRRQTVIQAMPFSSNFSPACGGNQKATKTMNTTTIAGTMAMALNIGDCRRKFKWNAGKFFELIKYFVHWKNLLLMST